jgi:four helix bundle protein
MSMSQVARRHQDLEVHKRAYALAMVLFRASKHFPKDELYSLTSQIRRSSRSITANIAEAWAKRRYEASFVAKLTDALAEVAETEDWVNYSVDCGYLAETERDELLAEYAAVAKTLNAMVLHASSWCSKETSYKPQAAPRQRAIHSDS